jgi:hypothetical protein
MPKIIDALRHLMNTPAGYNADGRTIGLGLATALAKQRAAEQVRIEEDADKHLRRWADDERLAARR